MSRPPTLQPSHTTTQTLHPLKFGQKHGRPRFIMPAVLCLSWFHDHPWSKVGRLITIDKTYTLFYLDCDLTSNFLLTLSKKEKMSSNKRLNIKPWIPRIIHRSFFFRQKYNVSFIYKNSDSALHKKKVSEYQPKVLCSNISWNCLKYIYISKIWHQVPEK